MSVPKPRRLRKLSSIYTAAADLLEDRKLFTKGMRARSADGLPVQPRCTSAVRFCAEGAIARVADPEVNYDASSNARMITTINDGPDGRAQVIRYLRELAARA